MKARLLTDAYKQDTGADLLELRVAEDLIAVVAYDLPENVMLPERADVLQYGDEHELLALALRHAREEEDLALERYELHGAPLYVLTGESFFTATHALWADRLPRAARRARDARRHPDAAHRRRAPDPRPRRADRDRADAPARRALLPDGPGLAERRPRTGSSTAAWSACRRGSTSRARTSRPHRASRACSRRWPVSDPERWRADSVAALAPYGFALPPHFPLLGDEDVAAPRPLEQVVARAQALVCMLNAAHGAPPEKVRRVLDDHGLHPWVSETERAFLDDPGDHAARSC